MRRRNQALTLIELVAALAIVAMLMAAAVSVVAGLSRAERRDQARYESDYLAEPLARLLTGDLLQATQFEKTKEGYRLRTADCIDGRTLERKHLPCRVEYRVQRIGPRRWLVRDQQPQTLGQDSRELVCCDVKSFALAPVSETAPGDRTMPPAMVATIEFTTPGRQPLRYTVHRD
jgi:prepilin-type N-terminal cleavage/methylation domain-containing protein